jgi:hypothetical protein
MADEKQNVPNGNERTLNDVTGMIDALAQSTAKGFDAMQRNYTTIATRMDTVIEMVGALQGQVSPMETDIKTIKGR